MATRKDRSEDALKTLKWPAWEKRRKAIAAAFATKIQHGKAPTVLEELIPGKVEGDYMQTRAKKRQDLQEPSTRIQFGQKSFAVWAPRLINEANMEDEDTDEEEEEDEENGDAGRKTQQMPADEFERQRLSYYGYLGNKYAEQIETVEDATVHVFTDSRYVQLGVTQWIQKWKAAAWYRRPGKAQRIDNVDLWKKV
eukprot:gene17928-biopygen16719